MRNYLKLFGLVVFFSFMMSSCIEDEPDYEPDFLVHTSSLAYRGDFFFYKEVGNTEAVGMKMFSGIGVPWNLKNCEIVGMGPIVESSNESIVIDATSSSASYTINPMEIKTDMGYVFKGDLVYGSTNKKIKTFYFYVYFSDFNYDSALGYYNPHTIHYQRFQ